MVATRHLIIPVENQVRELDPKLLLAVLAARRGFSSLLGSRRELEFGIAQAPQSVYLGKSMTVRGLLFFRVARKLGHRIVTWDEEALVHLPPEVFYPRRISPPAIRCVSALFAWGEDNAELWRQYPHLPRGLPIHVTGNPRNDMIRPELRPFYAEEVRAIREKHGDFFLVNTNFNHVNAFFPGLNLFIPEARPGRKARYGRGARGMPRDYAEGLRDQKQAIFEAFLRMIPALEEAFPDHRIVVRPHPTEKQDVYRDIAARCARVRVTNEGNVVPWLLAAQALVHNGCTTGVEAYMMRVPAVSYRARVDDRYDRGFYRLPNLLSHERYDLDGVISALREVAAGALGPAGGPEREALAGQHLAALDGPLACERILDAVEAVAVGDAAGSGAPAGNRLERALLRAGLRVVNGAKDRLPGGQNSPEFQKHRYPGISLTELQARIERFEQILGPGPAARAEDAAYGVFRIGCGARA